jgi:hypothetical protein
MPGGGRAAHDESSSQDRETLRAFVDVFQVMVGRVQTNAEGSTALLRTLLTRMLGRLPEPSPAQPTTNFRPDTTSKASSRDDTRASAAQHVDVTPSHPDAAQEQTGLTFLQHLRASDAGGRTAAADDDLQHQGNGAPAATRAPAAGRDFKRARMRRARLAGDDRLGVSGN